MSSVGRLRPTVRRLAAWSALIGAVVLAHGCTVHWAAARLVDLEQAAAMPPRPALVSVRTLEPDAPVVVAAPPARRESRPVPPSSHRIAAALPDDGPSAESPPASTPDVPPETDAAAGAADAGSAPAASAPAADAVAVAASAASDAASASVATALTSPASGAASAPAFVWPESTLVSYRLTGNYQGDIHGKAEVEWIKQGRAYEMHMDIVIGLPFAPLLDRHLRSTGRITADGLVPERFDEDSKRAFQPRWRVTMAFDEGGIQVGGVRRFDRVPGVQDTLSQFGQLSFRFALNPGLLTPGGTVALPLALPRHVDVWSYHVLPPETLQTPFGPLDAVHLMPTKPPGHGDLSAEIWFAPTLRYLPVRIRIAQDAATWIDLVIDRKPQLEAPAP